MEAKQLDKRQEDLKKLIKRLQSSLIDYEPKNVNKEN